MAGTVSEDQPIAAHGGGLRVYTFTHTAPPGTAYVVTIITQPAGQNCTLANASGTVGSTSVEDINVTCDGGPTGLIWGDGHWDDANWQ